MKIWMKYTIGIVIGIMLTLIFPFKSETSLTLLNFCSDLFIHFGRFIILPLLFFTASTAWFTLRDEKRLLRTFLWTAGVIIAASLLLTVFGLITALMIHLPKIPMSIENSTEIPTLNLQELILKLFPYSGFSSILEDSYLLPCFVFAGFAGFAAAAEKNDSKAAVSVFTSFAEICWTILRFFTEIFSIGMIALTCRWLLNFIPLWNSGIFKSLIKMLTVDLLIITFVIYPITLKLTCPEAKILKVLYSCIAPFFTAFITGDSNISYSVNMRHGRESLGIKSELARFSFPMFSIFSRGGSALITTICFIQINRFYSGSYGIPFSDVLWIGASAFLLSFVLAELPAGGAFFAITILCSMKGSGFTAGYLLLKETAPVVCCFAAGIDAVTAMFGNYIIAYKTKLLHSVEIKKFI
ncbi:dicarboxylate/amino acid:cation symporter [Treponema rectale]|uniref:Dicarboxylate/amino acid:cation symporter n=1 Tax=Treponema rectale TaxID=744512 RepID=A0A840SH72_9SPIR|nr:cation:dicarboxylase symporter family transporter [Treponema rectale]MBB5220045.1 Na+/H+-dicarboxylate symporter [Treponema rectale]QOS40642.1 dicarboxylate/amino acid:cation symporter [Treponema rectale]